MNRYHEFPKWKYARPASEIEKPRSVIVANSEQEAALDGDWYDTPDYKNDSRTPEEKTAFSGIPNGYEPQEYPKWLYNASVIGGRLVYNQGEEDDLKQAYPGDWQDTPPEQPTDVQMKAFGLPEDTGLNPNDPLMATDPVKLENTSTLPQNAEQAAAVTSEAQKQVDKNAAKAANVGKAKSPKNTDNKADTAKDGKDEDLL